MQKKEEMFVYSESLFYICRHIKASEIMKNLYGRFYYFYYFADGGKVGLLCDESSK